MLRFEVPPELLPISPRSAAAESEMTKTRDAVFALIGNKATFGFRFKFAEGSYRRIEFVLYKIGSQWYLAGVK